MRSGRALIEADYQPSERGIGLLSLKVVDQGAGDYAEGMLRLDPWFDDEYEVIERETGNCFLIGGAQAIVAVDLSSLAGVSSFAVEYREVDEVGTLGTCRSRCAGYE
jgi:hypothetical protein